MARRDGSQLDGPDTGGATPAAGATPSSDGLHRTDGAAAGRELVPVRRPADANLGEAVGRLAAGDDLSSAERRNLLGRIVAGSAGAFKTVWKPRQAAHWMADTLTDAAPHIPIRDLETLHRHFDGLDGDPLAERLVRNATRLTAAIGAAGGGLAAVEWAVPPSLLTAPVLLTAETLAVVAVEVKLIGELHEVYHQPVEGSGTHRAAALVQAWAGRRGVNPLAGRGMTAVLGTAARRELQGRLVKRFGRNLTTLGPLLSGAAVAGYLNRRSTRSLAEEIRKDLAKRARSLPPA